jgi:hypothetical protein
MAGEVERARAAANLAVAAAGDFGFDSPQTDYAVAVAKVTLGQVVPSVVTSAHQLHGAIGVTIEHRLWLANLSRHGVKATINRTPALQGCAGNSTRSADSARRTSSQAPTDAQSAITRLAHARTNPSQTQQTRATRTQRRTKMDVRRDA